MDEDYSFYLISCLTAADNENYKRFNIKNGTEIEFIETFSNLIDTIIGDHINNIHDIPIDNLYTFIAIHLSNPIIQNIVLKKCIDSCLFFEKYKNFITDYIVKNKIFNKEIMADLLNSLPIMKSFILIITQCDTIQDNSKNIIIELVEYFEKHKINITEICDGIIKFLKSDEILFDYFMIFFENIIFNKINTLSQKHATQFAHILSCLSLSAEQYISVIDDTCETINDVTKTEYLKIVSPWHKLLFFTNAMIYVSTFSIIKKKYRYDMNGANIQLFKLYLDVQHLTIKRIKNILSFMRLLLHQFDHSRRLDGKSYLIGWSVPILTM
jgi:hypothetical protein